MNSFFGAYGISHSIGARQILDEVSFEMQEGEILALLGPNGAGKSTLLKILSGVLKPESGAQVRMGAEDLLRVRPARRARKITYVGAELRAEFPVTALEAVMMGRFCHHPLLQHGLSEGDRERVRQAMEECLCWEFRDQELRTLSGGEKQLVALARALAQESKVILLDETLSKMDLHHQASIGKLLVKIARQSGLGIILVSHDVNLAAEWADTALLLVDGRKQAHGKLASVLTDEHFQRAYPGAGIAVGKNPFSGAPRVFFR